MASTAPITLPGRFRGVVLDMDGLLIDTEPIWREAKIWMFRRHGAAFEHADHLAVFGRDEQFTASYLTSRFGLGPEDRERVRAEYLGNVADRFAQGIEIRHGAMELIASLHGRVPMALASNTRRSLVDIALTTTGIGSWLDAVVTADDADAKPAPGIYLEACRRIRVAPAEAVALEDSPTGIAAAKAAGMTCIGVPSELPDDLAAADFVVPTLMDLLEPIAQA